MKFRTAPRVLPILNIPMPRTILMSPIPLALLIAAGCAHTKPQPAPPPPQVLNLFLNPDPAPPRSTAKNIIVPTREIAIRIARAVWGPVYGEKTVQASQTFQAELMDGIWRVTAKFGSGALAEGTAIMEISQEDGRVSRIAHGLFQPGSEWR